jgi:hypothetical protein
MRGFETKTILKEAMLEYLPREILYRKKQGYSLPIKNWLRNELRDYARHEIERSELVREARAGGTGARLGGAPRAAAQPQPFALGATQPRPLAPPVLQRRASRRGRVTRKTAWLFVRLGVSAALIGWLLRRVDARAVAEQIGSIGFANLLVILALQFLNTGLKSYKWQRVLAADGIDFIRPRSRLSGFDLFMFLTTAIGGDAVRAVDVAQRTGGSGDRHVRHRRPRAWFCRHRPGRPDRAGGGIRPSSRRDCDGRRGSTRARSWRAPRCSPAGRCGCWSARPACGSTGWAQRAASRRAYRRNGRSPSHGLSIAAQRSSWWPCT